MPRIQWTDEQWALVLPRAAELHISLGIAYTSAVEKAGKAALKPALHRKVTRLAPPQVKQLDAIVAARKSQMQALAKTPAPPPALFTLGPPIPAPTVSPPPVSVAPAPEPAPAAPAAPNTLMLDAIINVILTAMESDRGQLALASALELALSGKVVTQPVAPAPQPEPVPPKRHNPEPAPEQRGKRPRVICYGLIAGQPAWVNEHYGSRLNVRFLDAGHNTTEVRDAAKACDAAIACMAVTSQAHLRELRQHAPLVLQSNSTLEDLKRQLEAVCLKLNARPQPHTHIVEHALATAHNGNGAAAHH